MSCRFSPVTARHGTTGYPTARSLGAVHANNLTALGEMSHPICIGSTMKRTMAAGTVRQYKSMFGEINTSRRQNGLAVSRRAKTCERAHERTSPGGKLTDHPQLLQCLQYHEADGNSQGVGRPRPGADATRSKEVGTGAGGRDFPHGNERRVEHPLQQRSPPRQ